MAGWSRSALKIRHLTLFVLCLMYFIAYVDRVNISVAAPAMQGITHSFARLGGAITPPLVLAIVARYGWRGSFIVHAPARRVRPVIPAGHAPHADQGRPPALTAGTESILLWAEPLRLP